VHDVKHYIAISLLRLFRPGMIPYHRFDIASYTGTLVTHDSDICSYIRTLANDDYDTVLSLLDI
jgi:hypothetical protein